MKYVLMSGSFTRMEIYQEIIDFLNKYSLNNKNIAFITADFSDYSSNDKYIKKLIKLFNDKKFIFNSVYIIDNRIDSYEMKNYIKDSDIVFLLGGDTLKQIKFIIKYKLKNIIKEKNKVVIGMSAGSINMAKRVVLARDIDDGIPNLSIYKGIGITDINIEPHCDFKNEEHWKDIEEASKYSNIIVMHDDCYIIVDNDVTSYYGSYVKMTNSSIYYKNNKCTLKEFLREINYD